LSHNPPTYSQSTDPLDADDWLKTITKKLEIVQCTDREMVLNAAGRLVGKAGDWWDAYATAHPIGRTSLGRSSGTTSVLITSLRG
jgi:hypothetical protein